MYWSSSNGGARARVVAPRLTCVRRRQKKLHSQIGNEREREEIKASAGARLLPPPRGKGGSKIRARGEDARRANGEKGRERERDDAPQERVEVSVRKPALGVCVAHARVFVCGGVRWANDIGLINGTR